MTFKATLDESDSREIRFKTTDTWSPEDMLSVMAIIDGGILITVEEEKAVDSYNATFSCSARLDRDEAKLLLAWLQSALAALTEASE